MKCCEICGTTKGTIVGKSGKFGMDLCNKHYLQMRLHGETFDKTIYSPNDIITNGDTSEIILRDAKCNEIGRTIIDTKHVVLVGDLKWCINKAGYVVSNDNKRLHRVIMGNPEGLIIDHINHNKLDNRESNLRVCTPQENSFNKKLVTSNTSGVTGVYWSAAKHMWCAQIMVNGKTIYLGRYKDKQDAIDTRKKAEIDYFAEFSYGKSIGQRVL